LHLIKIFKLKHDSGFTVILKNYGFTIMSVENIKLTQLSDLGEFGLIEHLTNDIKIKNTSTIKGIGDDAAILSYGDKHVVITTDLLVEGIHFDLVYTPLKHLGYKAVTVNLSDVYAMNAIPKQITVAIAVSGKFSVEALDQLYEGIKKACENYDVDLVGGDTVSSLTGLTISVTAIGEVDKGKAVQRNSAKVGNLVCMTGDVGAAYAGLQILKREKEVFLVNPNSQPDMSGYDYVLERQLKPECQKGVIAKMMKMGIIPTAMIDISDGLSSEIIHICKQSGVGVCLYEDKIPLDVQTIMVAEELNIEPIIMALNGGEDYELLFTIKKEDESKIMQIEGVSIIGEIVNQAEGLKLHGRGEGEITIQAQGWNAYKE